MTVAAQAPSPRPAVMLPLAALYPLFICARPLWRVEWDRWWWGAPLQYTQVLSLEPMNGTSFGTGVPPYRCHEAMDLGMGSSWL